MRFCRPLRSSEDCEQFVCFPQKVAHQINSDNPVVAQTFQPEDSFVRFFNNDSDLRYELRLRSSSRGSAIVRCEGSARSKKLLPDDLCFGRSW
jgi:hypothetical protein